MKISFLSIFIILCSSIVVLSQTDTSSVDSALMRQLEMITNSSGTSETSVASGGGRSLSITNPRISLITDFQGYYHYIADKNFAINLNELEMAFQSAIDPYAKADIYYSLEKNPENMKMEGDIEEAYLTTLSLPFSLQLKAGRIKNTFGRANLMHSHAQPFIRVPFMFENFLGDGLSAEGLSLSWLVPQSLFYQELTMEITDGPIESPVFSRGRYNDFLYCGHLKNFFTLSDDITLELGISAVNGPNDSSGTTFLGGADLTLKWKPLQRNTYRSFTWQSEYIFGDIEEGSAGQLSSKGFYSLISWQFARRLFFTTRVDYAENPYNTSDISKSLTGMFGWFATEFQKLELEGSVVEDLDENLDYFANLRWIFVIGSHGAHTY